MFLTMSFVVILMMTYRAVAAIPPRLHTGIETVAARLPRGIEAVVAKLQSGIEAAAARPPKGIEAVAAKPPKGIKISQRLLNTEFTDSLFSNRHKRAIFVFRIGLNLVKKGMDAMDFLLKDATQVPSYTSVRQYQKLGSYQKALKDFDSLNPYGVRPFEMPDGVYGKVGQVGDRSLVVKSSDGYGNPVIEIIQVKGVTISDGKRATAREITDKISYVHKLCKSDCDRG